MSELVRVCDYEPCECELPGEDPRDWCNCVFTHVGRCFFCKADSHLQEERADD